MTLSAADMNDSEFAPELVSHRNLFVTPFKSSTTSENTRREIFMNTMRQTQVQNRGRIQQTRRQRGGTDSQRGGGVKQVNGGSVQLRKRTRESELKGVPWSRYLTKYGLSRQAPNRYPFNHFTLYTQPKTLLYRLKYIGLTTRRISPARGARGGPLWPREENRPPAAGGCGQGTSPPAPMRAASWDIVKTLR